MDWIDDVTLRNSLLYEDKQIICRHVGETCMCYGKVNIIRIALHDNNKCGNVWQVATIIDAHYNIN